MYDKAVLGTKDGILISLFECNDSGAIVMTCKGTVDADGSGGELVSFIHKNLQNADQRDSEILKHKRNKRQIAGE